VTNLEFTRDIIRHNAANMDAEEFQNFLENYEIDHELIDFEWVEVNVGDYNDGIYDVYLIDVDMPVRFINGKYIPEEDL